MMVLPVPTMILALLMATFLIIDNKWGIIPNATLEPNPNSQSIQIDAKKLAINTVRSAG